MSITLAMVFDEHFKHVKFDGRLAKDIYKYQIGYLNQNHEHLEFFGSNLLGVHVVRYKDSDVLKLFNLLDVDLLQLSESIKQVDDVNQEFKISSDVFNLTCMYLIHKFLTASTLNDNQRFRAAYDCAVIFYYRCIAALMSYYFRYPTDPKVAQAAYANLSNKFLIKRLGSWHRVVDYRANALVNKKSLHYKTLFSFNNDTGIVNVLGDSQGRIRDMIKNYCKEFYKVNEEGSNIGTTSGTMINQDGEESNREKTKSVETVIVYLQSIISDKRTFIKEDLVKIITSTNSNTSYRMIKACLEWLSDSTSDPKRHEQVNEFITRVVIYTYYLIDKHMRHRSSSDYVYILNELKNLYLSTRNQDDDLIKIRKLGDQLIRASSKTKISNGLVLATRISIILYISLRAIIGQRS